MQEKVLLEYKKGLSAQKVADKYDLKVSTVKHWVRSRGLARKASQTRRLSSKSKLNSDLFSNSRLRSWFVGVVFGDGNVTPYTIEVKKGNPDFLESICRIIGYGRVDYSGRTPKYCLSNKDVCDFFKSLLNSDLKKGIQIYYPPSIGYESDFWRGIIDTDGSIVKVKYSWGYGCTLKISSISINLIKDFEKFCFKNIRSFVPKKIDTGRSKISSHDCYNYRLGFKESVKILDIVYNSSDSMRNNEKFKKYIILKG